mmetsp:Transcript_147456/g.268786  ORF Transcript_147456/g.268786 Transcript_147456/m.268786 type:complete len:284 (-) Transcript_147456:92-943(-)
MSTGEVVGTEIGGEKSQKDYYQKASHYDILWGQDNIHLGIYPHLEGSLMRLTFSQAADNMTERMIKLGKITAASTVLDLGCGKGKATRQIAQQTGATCVGLDLTPANVERAQEIASSLPALKLEYVQGSFTDLPEAIKTRQFTHCWSQVAFCHVHNMLPTILEQVKSVLAPGGVLVVSDYLGGDVEVTEMTKVNVWKRLHFEHLHGHIAWRKIADESGLIMLHYENLDNHMAEGYRDLTEGAAQHGFKSADGTPLCENYAYTTKAIENREIGMNLAILMKPSA